MAKGKRSAFEMAVKPFKRTHASTTAVPVIQGHVFLYQGVSFAAKGCGGCGVDFRAFFFTNCDPSISTGPTHKK